MGLGKVVIAGGTGYLGRALAAHLAAQGREVVLLARRPRPGLCREVGWDGETLGRWAFELEGAEALINLAGRSVNCRYHARNRREILASRVRSTRVLGEAVARCARPPAVWLNASTATIYRHALDRPMDEATGELGSGFSVDVARAWEAAFFAAEAPRTRKVALRTAMVFGPGRDGVLEAFARLARVGLGGTLGPGDQFVSWIHLADFCRAVDWLLAHPELEGAVNVAAPEPVRNAELMRRLREVQGVRFGLPATRAMLELGAFVLRTETELLLKSRRVVPGRLLASGFRFRYPEVGPALEALLGPAATAARPQGEPGRRAEAR